MTAATITNIAREDIPTNTLGSSTVVRRSRIYITATTTSKTETVTLTTYDPSIADIEGVVSSTLGDAVNTTAHTWSSAVLTLTNDGANEVCLIVTHT